MFDLEVANEFTREIVNELQNFESQLPDDKRVGVIIDGSVIAVERATRLLKFGRILLHGTCTIPSPPLSYAQPVTVLLQPMIPSLTLTAVQRKDKSPRKLIGIEVRAQESLQD